MSTPPPVVALHRLPAEVALRVEEACARAGARAVESDATPDEAPVVVVAHLPRRARRIPADALAVAGRAEPPLPLVLACDEALVQPATTLFLGGVTLVEHAARERLYSQLRVVLAAARTRSPGDAASAPSGDSAGAHFWLGASRGAHTWMRSNDDAVSAVVPSRESIEAGALLSAAERLVGSNHTDLSAAFVELLGDAAGFVHLSRGARSWVIHWPAAVGALWLSSSHRLPHLSELSRPSDVPRFFRSPAAPGEIVLAATRSFGDAERHVAHGLVDGGPTSLDRLCALSPPVDGFVLEVR